MPPKRRKNKGGDSDEDPLASQLAYLKAKAGGDSDEDMAPIRDSAPVSKKDKKKTKGGKQQAAKEDNDDDDGADAAAVEESRPTNDAGSGRKGTKKGNKKSSQDSDEDEDEDMSVNNKKGGKAAKKSKKGNKKGGLDSDEERETAAAATSSNKGNKKGQRKKGKRGGDTSSDDDDASKPSVAPAADSDDDGAGAGKGGAKKMSKKDKKKAAGKAVVQKKGGKKRGDDSDDEVDNLKLMMKKLGTGDSSEEEEEEEESDDEEAKAAAEAEAAKRAAEKKARDEAAAKAKAEADAVAAAKAEADAVAAAEARAKAEEEAAMQAAADQERAAAEALLAAAAAAAKAEAEAVAQAKADEEAAIAAKAAAIAAAAPKKAGKKTKLELKLEEAKRKKDEADAIAKRKAEEEAAARAIVEAAEAKEAAEKKTADDAIKAAQAEENAAAAASSAAASAAAAEIPEEEVDEDAGKSQEQLEKEMRMRATMFGDEVQPDYMVPGGDQGSDGEGEYGKSKHASRSQNRLSAKAKRKEAQAAERQEREKEYNKAAMKASAEGQQFACSQSIVAKDDPQWNNALDIIIPSFSISAHNKELFVNSELSIVHGRRYGLVAPNGAGKSTLLKMIAAGELKVPPRVDYLYVEQEVVADETAAVDAVLKADKVRWELLQEEKQLLADLEKKADETKDVRLGEIHEQLDSINASSAEARARRILFGLGFDGEMQTRPTKFFSGGWRMRISLARALFIEPTLLMLDEPTNHLDLNAVIWLDDYLQKWKKTLLVVSHDQDFLNSVCQEILHLDQRKLNVYRGNYDTFKEQEATKRKQLQKEWEKQEKRLRELKAKGVTKDNAEKAQLKAKAREPGARGGKKKDAAAVVSGGLESGASQVKLIERPREYLVTFSFPEVLHVPPPILEVRDVNFRYGPKLPWLFRGLNFGLDMDSRVCIVGPNGSGKSTIIKLITEEVKPPEGEVFRNPRLRVGVYNQHFMDRLPMEEDAVTYLRRLFNNETYQSCRNLLGKYGLEGHAHCIPIRDLSGGQKARVVFVELSLMAPHLLFLDEPTNNLDIESIDALCDALKEYNGGVVLVSHDARLIETIEAQLWVVDDQNVTPWVTGFDGYRKYLLEKLEEQLAAIMPGSGERPT